MPSELKKKDTAEPEIKEEGKPAVRDRRVGDIGMRSCQGSPDREAGSQIDQESANQRRSSEDKEPELPAKHAREAKPDAAGQPDRDRTLNTRENDQELEQWNSQTFGTALHSWYAQEGESRFAGEDGDEVYAEKLVRLTHQDGTEGEGKVDLVVHDRHLFDFKSDDMRGWTEANARARANEYGAKFQEYLESPDTPEDATGWIIATTPSESDRVNKAFEEKLGEYGIKVRFSKDVGAQSVLDEVESVVRSEDSTREDGSF